MPSFFEARRAAFACPLLNRNGKLRSLPIVNMRLGTGPFAFARMADPRCPLQNLGSRQVVEAV